jgi:hypothetical protein
MAGVAGDRIDMGFITFIRNAQYYYLVIFIIDFVIKFILAPQKFAFFKKQWLTAISLVIPALRIVRIFRVARLLRGLRSIRQCIVVDRHAADQPWFGILAPNT